MEKKNRIVAIDLGSSHVAAAVGSKTADGRIEIEDVVLKESRGVTRGEVKNVEQAAQSVKEAVRGLEERLGIEVREVYTGISGSHIRCAKHPYYVYVGGQDGEIGEEDVRKLNESMRNVQAPDRYCLMHIIPQHYLVDDEEEVADPVGMFGKTLGSTFNLIIGDNTTISRLEKALQKVDIAQKKLYIDPLVSAAAVTFPDEKDLGVAVVDLGAGTTDLCIYQDGIVRYVGVIPLGMEAVNKDIRAYGIMDRYVEELKVTYGCAVPSLTDGEKLVKVPGRTPHDHKEISFRNLASIIEARLFDIVDYIIEEIKTAGYEGKLSAGIILTGGGSLVKEIKTLVQERTGLDVRLAVPDVLVSEESKEKVNDPRLATVVGILCEGLQEEFPACVQEAPKKSVTARRTPVKEETISSTSHIVKESEETKPEVDLMRDDDKPEEPPVAGKDKKEKKEGRGLLARLKDKMSKARERFEEAFDTLDDNENI